MKNRSSALLLAVLLSGCATVTFKAGATPTTMADDEKTCREGEVDDAAFVQCMRKKGWYVAGGASEAAAAEMRAAAAEKAAPPSVAAPVVAAAAVATAPPAASEAPRAVPTSSPTPTVAGTAAATPEPTAAPSLAMPPAAPAQDVRPESPGLFSGSGAPAPIPVAEVPVSAMPPGSESLPRVRVSSWWKLGGSAAGLQKSVDTCIDKLGPPHRPDPGVIFVTAAMRDCLRSEGWYSYGEAPVQ